MKPDDDKVIRVSFALYPSDNKVLRRLNLVLRDAGLDVVRTDTLRFLLHTTSSAEMFALTTLRLKEDAAGRIVKEDHFEERVTLRSRKSVMDKIDDVVDDLARKDLDADRTYVIRAVLHGDHDPKALVRSAKKFLAEFPDGRTRAGRAER